MCGCACGRDDMRMAGAGGVQLEGVRERGFDLFLTLTLILILDLLLNHIVRPAETRRKRV
jgi:hypothetical protein